MMVNRLKNKTHILILINIFLLISCNKSINHPIQHFEKCPKQALNHSKLIELEEFDILKPGHVFRMDDSYMFWDFKNETMFHLVNFESKEIIKGVQIGNGPGEIIFPSSPQLKDSRFLICETDRKKIYQIDISSDTTLILKDIEDINSEKRLFIINYQNSHIIATGLFEDAWLATLNVNGEIISKVDFPSFDETSNTPMFELSMLYLSTHIVNSPDNKKVVAATQDLGLIAFFNFIDGSKLEEYKRIKYYGPKFSLNEKHGIAFSKDGQAGFCDLDCNDEYVYALYSGRTVTEHGMLSHHCENLLVYDWDGNPVKHYILDIPLFSMKYDKEKNSIYGIGYNPEGAFVEYKLDDL